VVERFIKLDKEILNSKTIDLTAPWKNPIAHFDENTAQYDEQVIPIFYFITKAGTCGAMMILRADPLMPSDMMSVRYIYEG
jgi:hypothetical protein